METPPKLWTITRCFYVVLCVLLAVTCGCSKQARRNRYLTGAQRDFQDGHYDRAEIEYRAALRITPSDPQALTGLGILYYNQGKVPQAYQLLKKSVEVQPDQTEARAKLGLTYLALHSLKDARQLALQVLQKDSGNRDGLLMLADSALQTNEVQEALQFLDALAAPVKTEAEYHIALGTLCLRQHELTNAEAEFNRAVALEPKSSVAHMALGNFYLFQNDTRQATPSLKAAAELAPLRSIARIRYAEVQLNNGDAAQATNNITSLLQRAPDYLPGWMFLAQVAWAGHNLDECASLLEKVTARDPFNYDALMLGGDLLLAKADGTNALARYERLAGLYGRGPQVLYKLSLANLANQEVNQALVNLNEAVRANPDFAPAVLLLANLNLRRGESAQTVALLNQLVRRQPQLAQAHLLLATAYLAQKDPDSAAAVYQHMLNLFPKSPEAPLFFGVFLAQQNKPAEARQAFEKSLVLDPNYFPAVENLVDLDIHDRNYDAALQRVQNTVPRNPSAAEPWLLLAKIHIAKAQQPAIDSKGVNTVTNRSGLATANPGLTNEDTKEAENELLKAIALKPDLRTPYLMLAQLYSSAGKQQQALDRLNTLLAKTNDVAGLMLVGMIQETLKNYPAAQSAYTNLLAISPNFSPALNNLAYLYSERLGDLEKAYHLAERAHQLLPYDPSTADTLGWIVFKRGEYARAAGLIDDAAEKLPNSGEIQLHLGMAHYMLDEEGPARIALEKAASSEADFPGKPLATDCLAVLAIDPASPKKDDQSNIQKRLHQNPGDPVGLLRLAAIQQRDGAPDKALDTYQTALKFNPQNARVMLGLTRMYASGQFSDAQKAFELAKNAHNLAPENALISALLGELAFRNGDYQWAMSLLEQSARSLPENPDVAYQLAWAYYSLGHIPDALASMNRAVSRSSTLSAQNLAAAQRFLYFVSAAQNAGVDEKLVSESQSICKTEPNYVPALIVCAIARENAGDFQQAADLYNQVLSTYPFFAPATRNLAILYGEHLGDEQKAYSLAVKAREAFPQDPQIAKILGVLSYRSGNYARASQLLKESDRARGGDPETLCYLGMVQYQLRSKAESKDLLERALALNLQPSLAQEARRILDELK